MAQPAGLPPTALPVIAQPTVPPPTVQMVAPPPTIPPATRLAEAAGVSAETARFVKDFLTGAVAAEILAYTYNDASYAAQFMAGNRMRDVETDIAYLKSQGVLRAIAIDTDRSYIANIRVIHDAQIEVDTCEVWSATYYHWLDGATVGADPPEMLPQTITIEHLSAGWFITRIAFHDPPSFCE